MKTFFTDRLFPETLSFYPESELETNLSQSYELESRLDRLGDVSRKAIQELIRTVQSYKNSAGIVITHFDMELKDGDNDEDFNFQEIWSTEHSILDVLRFLIIEKKYSDRPTKWLTRPQLNEAVDHELINLKSKQPDLSIFAGRTLVNAQRRNQFWREKVSDIQNDPRVRALEYRD